MTIKYYRGMIIGDGSQASDVWEFRITDDLDTGDSVAGVVVSADTGVTAALDSFDGESAFVRISGGTAGETYQIRVVLTTTAGDIKDMLVNYSVPSP